MNWWTADPFLLHRDLASRFTYYLCPVTLPNLRIYIFHIKETSVVFTFLSCQGRVVFADYVKVIYVKVIQIQSIFIELFVQFIWTPISSYWPWAASDIKNIKAEKRNNIYTTAARVKTTPPVTQPKHWFHLTAWSPGTGQMGNIKVKYRPLKCGPSKRDITKWDALF